jgi:hypothetical protein
MTVFMNWHTKCMMQAVISAPTFSRRASLPVHAKINHVLSGACINNNNSGVDIQIAAAATTTTVEICTFKLLQHCGIRQIIYP